jgi:exonuclease VII large subunit
MMKKLILFIGVIVFSGTISFAQTKNDSIQLLQKQVVHLENLNSRLSTQVGAANSNIKKLEDKLVSTVDSVDVLKKALVLTNSNMAALQNKLEMQIRQAVEKSDSDYSVLSKRVSNNDRYWILAIIAIVLIPSILFGWSRIRLTNVKTELSDQIKTSSEGIRQEIMKLDNQVFWSLDLQKKLNDSVPNEMGIIDHTLVLKVADEIIRIQKNLSNLDQETKGVKQLEFAVERIQDNFKENGYEIVELLNKPYDQGMKLSAKFKPDESLKKGEKIITRIIKPQVNYLDDIIQEAQVEVSINDGESG